MTLVTDPGWHGIGDLTATIQIMVAKAPPMQEFACPVGIAPLLAGQVHQIGMHCGNGWRKVFNVYSKLVFALPTSWRPKSATSADAQSWQQWRDNHLLQVGSGCALLFGEATALAALSQPAGVALRLIAGRQHARALVASGALLQLEWLDDEFAIDASRRTVVCPYLDYRQLSDAKIDRLMTLLSRLTPTS